MGVFNQHRVAVSIIADMQDNIEALDREAERIAEKIQRLWVRHSYAIAERDKLRSAAALLGKDIGK